jgi:hypothetical protein
MALSGLSFKRIFLVPSSHFHEEPMALQAPAVIFILLMRNRRLRQVK